MTLRSLTLYIIAVLLFSACGARETDSHASVISRLACLGYDSTVTITGLVRSETHPGPPQYESVATGDEAQTGLYLHLATPICTNATAATPDEMATDSVVRVQLVLDSAGFATFRPLVEQRVSLSGTLFSAVTGHHHAPLLLRDVHQSR